MFDPIALSLAAAARHSDSAVPLVLLAGAASSIGPCVAPRFIAVTGISAGRPRRTAIALGLCFVAGLICAYAIFGAATSVLGRAAALSSYTYAAVALVLAISGIVSLWREAELCDGEHRARRPTSAGGAFLLGASCALVVSPCCTPLIVGIVAYTSSVGNAAYGSILLACFGLGHALPLLAVTFGAGAAARVLNGGAVRRAAPVVAATLMLGLAGYYAVLA